MQQLGAAIQVEVRAHNNELFPYGLLDAAKVKSCLGVDASPTIDETDLFKGLVKFMNDEGLKQDAQYSLLFGHDDFRVVVVTKFFAGGLQGVLEERRSLISRGCSRLR